jgi:stage II sporulation protein D
MNRISTLLTGLLVAAALITPTAALGASDADIVLTDGELSGWTAPDEVGQGPSPVDEGENTEQFEEPPPDISHSAELSGATDVIISGAGWSHGVGMSQYGAYAQALAGRGYGQILASYYPGTTLTSGAASETFWLNLEQELVKVVLTAKQITASAKPVTVTRGSESVVLGNGDSVTIEYTGLSSGIRECTFSSGTFASVVGPCNLDLEWDGWVASPTMRVVIDKVWYSDSPTAGEECAHSVAPLTLECAYSRGTIHIRPDDNDEPAPGDIGFHVVVEIDRDDYALGIGESPYSWPSDALKTQAIASRSFASWVTDTRGAIEDRQWCWCNIYDQFPDQVYLGWGFGTAKWVTAVRDTDTQLMMSGGSPVAAFFGSSTGGATENNEDIWNGAPIAYLRSNPDVWSLSPVNPRRTWDAVVSSATFASKLGFTSVSSVEVRDRFESGTPSDVVVTGTSGSAAVTKHFTGIDIQSKFGLRSPHLNQIRGPFASGDPIVDRRAGGNRYETAVAVSWKNFDSGSGPAVVVVRGDLFPDALSAAPLAASMSGPVLLTPSTYIPGIVAAELERLDPSRIYIVGGDLAVSDSVANKLATYAPVQRLSGANRFDTSAEISQWGYPGGADHVYLATASDFADALSGAAIAGTVDAPILLVSQSSVSSSVQSEIQRLGASHITLLGGPGAVSYAVQDSVDDL